MCKGIVMEQNPIVSQPFFRVFLPDGVLWVHCQVFSSQFFPLEWTQSESIISNKYSLPASLFPCFYPHQNFPILEMFLFFIQRTNICLKIVEITPCYFTSYNYLKTISRSASAISMNSPALVIRISSWTPVSIFGTIANIFVNVNKVAHKKNALYM